MLPWHPRFSAGLLWWCWPAAFAAMPPWLGQQRLSGGEGASAAPPGPPSPGDFARGVGISRRVLTNPLVVAVSPRLQRLLDDSCALDPTKEAEALRLAENEL